MARQATEHQFAERVKNSDRRIHMKLSTFMAIVVLTCAPALHASLAEPVLSWHTNMGSVGQDLAEAIAVDGSGNIYVAGWTESTWGNNPIHPYAGGRDAFVAKLNSSGERLWHTFMGSSGWDEARSVAVDGDGNVYVTGTSDASWGTTPVHSHAGGDDGFAVKLNSDGERQWHTFMGNFFDDWGRAIAVDTSGNIYVAGGGGWWWWDTVPPVDPLQGSVDMWVTKLSPDGVRQWYTFLGSEETDWVFSIAVDGNGNVFVAGRSDGDWGSPINPYAGGMEALVAKLNTSGERLWHTFMGSSGNDGAANVAVDGSGNIYVSGGSQATWGTPINPGDGGFAAKLNSSGVRQWHTFLGSEGVLYGVGLAIDENRNIFTGDWWKSVQLSPDGIIQRHFAIPHGASGWGQVIAVDTRGNVYFGGFMDIYWWIEPISTAIVPWIEGNGWNACVVKFETTVEIDIDIKPGSDPNSINPTANGIIPVAILTTNSFDATSVDPLAVEFGPDGATESHGRGHTEDFDGDGDLDLVLHFKIRDTGIVCGDTSAFLIGSTFDGQLIEGFDAITTAACE
jgi:hypothetical protein